MNYVSHLSILLSIYGVVALGLNLIVGYCGRLVLSQAAFFGTGAYVFSLVSMRTGGGFMLAVTMAILAAAALSTMISLPAGRFEQDFFLILSLAVQTMIFSLIYNWVHEGSRPGTWANLTNGPFGLTGISRPRIGGWYVDSLPDFAAFTLGWLILIAVICWRLTSSPWGRLLEGIRDDSEVVAGLGKNVRLAETTAFAIGCGMAALAGALYASYASFLDPTVASLDNSILMLSMVIVGGTGNFVGPFVGAAILILLPEGLQLLNIPGSLAANLRLMAYGGLLVLLMHRRPRGLAGEHRVE